MMKEIKRDLQFIFIIFWLLIWLLGCAYHEKNLIEIPQNCPTFEGGCPDYFKRVWSGALILEETQNKYVKTRKKFRLDNTYNQPLLDELVESEKPLDACFKATPLGNKGERREFFAKMNSSSLRAVNETDRYFQNKLADHYSHNTRCFRQAQITLDILINE